MSSKLTALPAAAALSASDLFYVVQGATSAKATGTQLLALLHGSTAPFTVNQAITSPSGTGLTVTSGGAATDVGLSVTKSSGALSAIDILLNAAGAHSFRIKPLYAGTNPRTYFNDAGAFYTNSWATISGTGSGTGDSYAITPPSTDPFMLGVWADVLTAVQVRAANVANSELLSGLDRNGNYTFMILEDGAHKWGASTRAALDTTLTRQSAGLLRINGAGGLLLGTNNAALMGTIAAGTFANLFQLDSGNNFQIGSTAVPQNMILTVASGKQVRFLDSTASKRMLYLHESTQTLSVNADDNGAAGTFVASAVGKKGVVGRAFSSGQTANLFEGQSDASVVLFAVTPTGGILGQSARASKTGNYTVLSTESGRQFDNVGAAGTVVFTLPTAAVGLKYGFCVKAAFTLQITAAASTTIALGSSISAAAGNITAETPYAYVELEAISTTEWVAKSVTGSWTVN